jgi:hypothetical protein
MKEKSRDLFGLSGHHACLVELDIMVLWLNPAAKQRLKTIKQYFTLKEKAALLCKLIPKADCLLCINKNDDDANKISYLNPLFFSLFRGPA